MKTTFSILPSILAMVGVAAAGITLEAAEPSSSSGLKSNYPGPPLGRATITCRDPDITVGNEALSMSWTWTPRGLRARGLLDVPTGHRHEIAGEVFQIVLTDGRCYSASELVPEARPRVSELAADSKAARVADRFPGRMVELPMHVERRPPEDGLAHDRS